jgi:serine protease Do
LGGASPDHAVESSTGQSSTPPRSPKADREHRSSINTHRLGDGFYLALPGDARTKERIAQLLTGKSPNDRRLGVALARPEVAQQLRKSVGLPDRDGLLVRGVSDDSPAAKAGLREGDLLVSANGTELKLVADLESILRELPDEQKTVVVGVVRGTEDLSIVVTFD